MVGETMQDFTEAPGIVDESDDMYIEYRVEESEQTNTKEEISRLAQEVLKGKHGRGPAREESLGELYRPVMDEVLRIRLQGA